VDVLDDILGTLDLRGVLYFRIDFSGPWGVAVPDLKGASRFHLVLQGRCRVEIASGAAIELGPGDLILIPRGRAHVMCDRAGCEAPPLETVLEAVGYDGRQVLVVGDADDNASTQLLCGHFSFRDMAEHPLISALPDHILVTSAMRLRHPWLDELLRLLSRRAFAEGLGSAASVIRLSEIMFIETLRAGIGQSAALTTVLSGFRDPHIGRALELIHRAPEKPWSVAALASEVGMSRSAFAERFRALVGRTPVSYLADWRLQKALALLDGSRRTVQQVAADTGYLSAAAFSRAFSGKFGLSPSDYRRRLT